MGLIICSKLVRVHMSQYIDQTELYMIGYFTQDRGSRPEVFLGKGVLKICSKFTEEHSCRSAISMKMQSSFIEIALRHGCSSVNLLHIFKTPFPKNTSGWLLLTRTSLSCMYIFVLVTWRYVKQLWLLDFCIHNFVPLQKRN